MSNSQVSSEIIWPEGMSEQEKNELRDVLFAFDTAAGDFEHDHTVVYPSEQERLRLFHAAQRRWSKAWSKPGPCMHPGCTSQSIARSHTIPMSGSIKQIAERGHVVMPRLGEDGVQLVSIGIRDASTFPGFCDVHEAQFAVFESQKRMSSEDHYWLQAFRTICREIYTKRHYQQKLTSGLDGYRKLRDSFLKARLGKVKSAQPVNLGSFTFENDAIETRCTEQIAELSGDTRELESLYQQILNVLRTAVDDVVMRVTILKHPLPVCLSGLGILRYRTDGTERRALCFLAIIPEATETKLMIGAAKAHEGVLARYMADESWMAMLGRIEAWMCHGSDHWFMSPSVWDAIPEPRKRAICERILDTAHSIAHPVEFSVLDGLRITILEGAEEQLRTQPIPSEHIGQAMQIIAGEKAKLAWGGPSGSSA